jgi:hypothetical protein
MLRGGVARQLAKSPEAEAVELRLGPGRGGGLAALGRAHPAPGCLSAGFCARPRRLSALWRARIGASGCGAGEPRRQAPTGARLPFLPVSVRARVAYPHSGAQGMGRQGAGPWHGGAQLERSSPAAPAGTTGQRGRTGATPPGGPAGTSSGELAGS